MNIHSALQARAEGLWLTIASISTVLVLGYVIGRWFHMRRKMSHLVASGTAICGGSAIAAVAPAVKANEKETSVSLGVVFLLNSVALLLFPLLGHWLGLTQHQFGLWSAIAIHDTSSVVGASSAYGSEALNVATTVNWPCAVDHSRVAAFGVVVPEFGIKKFRFRGSLGSYRGDATEQLPAVRRDVQYAAHYGV